jgi:hypothetical protein
MNARLPRIVVIDGIEIERISDDCVRIHDPAMDEIINRIGPREFVRRLREFYELEIKRKNVK